MINFIANWGGESNRVDFSDKLQDKWTVGVRGIQEYTVPSRSQ